MILEIVSWAARVLRESRFRELIEVLVKCLSRCTSLAWTASFAFGNLWVHVEQMRCWKNCDASGFVVEWQFPHIFALISVRVRGGVVRSCACGVRAAVTWQVKHCVHSCVWGPLLHQEYPCGVVVPHIWHEGIGGVLRVLWGFSVRVRHVRHRRTV